MEWYYILLIIILSLLLIILITTYICFRLTFYVNRKKEINKEEFDIPPGEIYEPYREQMITWMKEARSMKHVEYNIISFDNLKLHAKYYELENTWEILCVFVLFLVAFEGRFAPLFLFAFLPHFLHIFFSCVF